MNGAYAATAVAILTALAKRGIVTGSASKVDPNNPHSNRIRVNFNLNRSTFGAKGLSDSEKYYQYSLYGNTTNIGNIQIQSSSRVNQGNELGLVMGWAEIVCLKNVTVWCDTGHMKKFHKAFMECQKKANAEGLNFHDENNDKYLEFVQKCIEEFKIPAKDKDGNIVQVSVTKTPFCFFEGDPLSLDQFKSELKSEGFDFDAPSGLAKFNPRNPFGQPPIFLFDDKIDPKVGKGNNISTMPAIVGAKYVCMMNTVATKFSPVYVWGPTVCSQDMVWDKSTTELRKWQGRQKAKKGSGYTNKVNTYNLYINILQKGRKLSKGYNYISKKNSLPQNYRMRPIVEQRSDKGIKLGYKGPSRPYIRNQKYYTGSKNNGKTPLAERQRIIARAKEIFNDNFSHINPNGNGMCIFWAVAAALAGTEFGKRYLIQAGDSQWKFIPDHLDDGVSANYFGYVFDLNDMNSRMAMAMGRLPEMHAWVVDADAQELIDMASFDFPNQAKKLQGYDWLSPRPPEVYWVTFDEEMSNRDTVYVPKEQALMGVVIPYLVKNGYIKIAKGRDGRAYIFAGPRIV